MTNQFQCRSRIILHKFSLTFVSFRILLLRFDNTKMDSCWVFLMINVFSKFDKWPKIANRRNRRQDDWQLIRNRTKKCPLNEIEDRQTERKRIWICLFDWSVSLSLFFVWVLFLFQGFFPPKQNPFTEIASPSRILFRLFLQRGSRRRRRRRKRKAISISCFGTKINCHVLQEVFLCVIITVITKFQPSYWSHDSMDIKENSH